jgi:hypothetical protein
MSVKVYFCVSFDDTDEAERIAGEVQELSSRPINELEVEPPKLKITAVNSSERSYLISPEVLLVEDSSDIRGGLVLQGKVVGSSQRFRIEFA